VRFYIALCLWAGISMSYYIAGAMALREQWFHGMRHARDPFAFGPDGQTLDKRKVVRLDAAGLVIGLLPDIGYEEQTVQLHSGDLLVAYTDGITEAMNVEGEEWGEERMLGVALCQDSSASETLHQIFQAADRFTTSATQHDDMTLLVMKVE
jgi:serine phosphatase RsbU (regulator of sigma subunit)